MKCVVWVISLLCVLNTQGAPPVLQVSGPRAPVLEGEDVTLECVSDPKTDMDEFTFQKYSKWMKTWIDLDTGRYFRCWYYNLNVTREYGRLLLQLKDISEWQSGPYRCVSNGNQSRENEASENVTIPVYYLRDIYFQRAETWNPNVGDVLLVDEGSDVTIKCSAASSLEPYYEWSQQFGDWIMPSDTLYLTKVNPEQAGRYTCQARHPEDYDLVKTKSFSLRVIPKHTEYLYAGAGVEDFLLYIAAPAVMLLLLVITLLVLCIRHRNRQMRKPHISWVNTEKRSPIYKGSAESVCATTSDTQPLFM